MHLCLIYNLCINNVKCQAFDREKLYRYKQKYNYMTLWCQSINQILNNLKQISMNEMGTLFYYNMLFYVHCVYVKIIIMLTTHNNSYDREIYHWINLRNTRRVFYINDFPWKKSTHKTTTICSRQMFLTHIFLVLVFEYLF